MATTVGSKVAAIERDCQALVAHLNKGGYYREAAQVQGLLPQVGNVQTSLQRDGIADQEFPTKT